MNLAQIKEYLKSVPQIWKTLDTSTVRESLALAKARAISEDEEILAKDIWCYETLLEAQDKYIQAFVRMRQGLFYEAWCDLERAEIALNHLRGHFQDDDKEYHVHFLEEQLQKMQSLFPYKLFMSIGFIKKEVRCGICDAKITPRSDCGHKKGEIYKGTMCTHVITELDWVEHSVVTSPRHKYAVPFLVDESGEKYDQYDYSLISHIVNALDSPFQRWDYEWTKKEVPHYLYQDLDVSELCPCESGKTYGACCLKKTGVLRPRLQIYLDKPLTKGNPNEVFIGFKRQGGI